MKDRSWSCSGPLHQYPLPDGNAEAATRMVTARARLGWTQELCARCGIRGWQEPGEDNGTFTRQNLRA